jgi:RNA 3'-terminal phosphate cyclase (ATP)
MTQLIPLDGSSGEGGGQILRTALALSALTGQAFAMTRIRERRARPGLRPQHLAAIRAAELACAARVSGAFEGSPDLRFEPGPVRAGSFRFEIGTAGSAPLVLQTVLPLLACAAEASRVAVTGGTHVPGSPSFDYLQRHWCAAVAPAGLHIGLKLAAAGFFPKGGGEVAATVEPLRAGAPLRLEERGALVSIRGVSGAARLRGGVAERQRDALLARLWEERRLEAEVEVPTVQAESPGSFLLVGAVFEAGRAALGVLGHRGLRAEQLGDQAARWLLRFLDGRAAVDPQLADQLAVPAAVSRLGARVLTGAVTRHLETVVSVLVAFGIPARVEGKRGQPGLLEVDPH